MAFAGTLLDVLFFSVANSFSHEAGSGVPRGRRRSLPVGPATQPAAQVLCQGREVLERTAQRRCASVPVAFAVHQRPLVTVPGRRGRLAQPLRRGRGDSQGQRGGRRCRRGTSCRFLEKGRYFRKIFWSQSRLFLSFSVLHFLKPASICR